MKNTASSQPHVFIVKKMQNNTIEHSKTKKHCIINLLSELQLFALQNIGQRPSFAFKIWTPFFTHFTSYMSAAITLILYKIYVALASDWWNVTGSHTVMRTVATKKLSFSHWRCLRWFWWRLLQLECRGCHWQGKGKAVFVVQYLSIFQTWSPEKKHFFKCF